MKRLLLLSVVGLAVVLAACSKSSNPLAPSPAVPASGTPTGQDGGAVVTGLLRLATVAPRGALITDSITVSIVGTSIVAPVSSSGQFTLSNVPAGDVQVRFAGGGNDATVTLADLQAGQTVTITVTVSGPTALVETEVRTGSGDVQVEGRIEALTTAPAGSFIVAGRTVRVDGQTAFRQGSTEKTFADLEIGMRVHVKGIVEGSGLLARLVEIQNVFGDLPVNVNGVIDSLSGTQLAFEFKIGSRLIKGDGTTTFFGNGGLASFASLKDGVRVEVKGEQRDGFVYAVRVHVDLEEDDPVPPGSEDCVHGTIASLTGVAPALTLVVNGRTVATTSATVVRRRGDVQTLAALQLGQTVSACGIAASGGAISAKTIQIQDDAVGGTVEIAGTVGGLKGACPAVTFKVNGFSIETNSTTSWLGASCSDLRNGSKAEVTGTSRADGSILATKVRR